LRNEQNAKNKFSKYILKKIKFLKNFLNFPPIHKQFQLFLPTFFSFTFFSQNI